MIGTAGRSGRKAGSRNGTRLANMQAEHVEPSSSNWRRVIGILEPAEPDQQAGRTLSEPPAASGGRTTGQLEPPDAGEQAGRANSEPRTQVAGEQPGCGNRLKQANRPAEQLGTAGSKWRAYNRAAGTGRSRRTVGRANSEPPVASGRRVCRITGAMEATDGQANRELSVGGIVEVRRRSCARASAAEATGQLTDKLISL